jgi:hypothetical protein
MAKLDITLHASDMGSLLSLPAAMAVVTQALRDDPDYAWSWHCNLTMMAQDAGAARSVADEGSARFLQLLAGVDIRQHPHFPPKRQLKMVGTPVNTNSAVEQIAQQAFFARAGIPRQAGSAK